MHWELRLMVDELQERAQYDQNIGDIAFDMDGHCDHLRKALRRDWAVRVLDAFQRAEMSNEDQKRRGIHCYETSLCFAHDGSEAWAVEVAGWDIAAAETPNAARLLAAEMFYPTLPESVRAELGPKP